MTAAKATYPGDTRVAGKVVDLSLSIEQSLPL